MNTERSCGCIIIKDNKALLIGAKDDDGKLFWSFPKGHQETGETDTETAIRETKEEIGLNVRITNIEPIKTGHLVHDNTAYKEIILFIAEPLDDNIISQEGEVEQIKWVEISEVEKYLIDYYSDAWRELLKRLGTNIFTSNK